MNLDKFIVGKTIKRVYGHSGFSTNDPVEQLEISAEDIGADSGSIFIEFTDGNVIEFWNSEWGGIKLKEENDS